MKALLKELGLVIVGLLIPAARALEAIALLLLLLALYAFIGFSVVWWYLPP